MRKHIVQFYKKNYKKYIERVCRERITTFLTDEIVK